MKVVARVAQGAGEQALRALQRGLTRGKLQASGFGRRHGLGLDNLDQSNTLERTIIV